MQPPKLLHAPQAYQLQVREHLMDEAVAWFGPQTISYEANGATTLRGPVRDQAELHGLLNKVRDLNLTLIFIYIQ